VFAQLNSHIFVVISSAYGMWLDSVEKTAIMLFEKNLMVIMSISWNCLKTENCIGFYVAGSRVPELDVGVDWY